MCSRRAFTLVELMIVLTVIAIMAAMCVPTFQWAVEQSRADVVAANLRAVWAAERLYWLEFHAYTSNLSPHNPPQANSLPDLGLLDPALPTDPNAQDPSGGYVYTVIFPSSDPNGINAFTATATRTGSSQWSGCFTVDQTGVMPGSNVVSAAGQRDIQPGFQ